MGAFPLRVLTTTFCRDVTAPGAPLGARRGFASMTPARRLAFPAGSVGCYACTVGLDKGARLGRGIALGVAGALLVFLALTTVQALGNHPPLFYLPESVVMRIGSPAVAIGAARLLSACFGAAGVLMVAWLALILLPSRPRVVVAAAVWLHSGRPVRRRLLAAAGAGAAGLAGAARGRRRVALLAGWLLLAFLMVAWYDGNGGHTHARFLLPAIGVVAIGAAVGLAAARGARGGLTALVVSVALLALTGFAWSRFVAAVAHAGATPAPTPRAVADMLHRHGVAHPWMLLAAASLTVLVGFILQQGGLRLLASEQPREWPALPPAEVRPEPAAHP